MICITLSKIAPLHDKRPWPATGTTIAALLAKDHASFAANFAESDAALLKVIAGKAYYPRWPFRYFGRNFSV
jgi:hypothetical protein